MEAIKWSKDFSVGIDFIDKQHLNIIEIINSLIKEHSGDNMADAINKALERMMEYTQTHFNEEEALLEKHRYPELDIHKVTHEQFLQKTHEFFERAHAEEAFNPAELIDYLKHWWTQHILVEDMGYKLFFKDRKIK